MSSVSFLICSVLFFFVGMQAMESVPPSPEELDKIVAEKRRERLGHKRNNSDSPLDYRRTFVLDRDSQEFVHVPLNDSKSSSQNAQDEEVRMPCCSALLQWIARLCTRR